MTALPDKNDLVSGSTTEGAFQAALGNFYDFVEERLSTGSQPILANTINEATANSGVTIDSGLVKDGTFRSNANQPYFELNDLDGAANQKFARLQSNGADIEISTYSDTNVLIHTALELRKDASGYVTSMLFNTGSINLYGTAHNPGGAQSAIYRAYAGGTSDSGLYGYIDGTLRSALLSDGSLNRLGMYKYNSSGVVVNTMYVGETTTVFNEEGNDIDFRIESDTNINMFLLDAGRNSIGFGRAPDANTEAQFGVKAKFYSGIQFDGNTTILSNFEEGTFTGTLYGNTTAGVTTYTAQDGSYQRVGGRCRGSLRLTWSNATGTGEARIGGLPYTSASGNQNRGFVGYRYMNSLALPANTQPSGYVEVNASHIRVAYRDNTGDNFADLQTHLTIGGDLQIFFDYPVA